MTINSEGATAGTASVTALKSPAVAGLNRLSAVDTVRARIALSIELGLLKPGEALPADSEVADALEVSEITVRRALKNLADDGLLIRKRGRNGGTFVHHNPSSPPIEAVAAFLSDTAEVHSLIDRRALLEAAITHHAALNASDAQLDELDSFVEQASVAQSWADYHVADEKLHLGVARASGLDWALPHYSEVLYGLYRYFLPYPVEFLHRVNNEHAQLVQALRDHDPVAAVHIIEQHVRALHNTMFIGLGDRDS